MAESIEYSSIVKFINDDIIQEKLANLSRQSGGMLYTDGVRFDKNVEPSVVLTFIYGVFTWLTKAGYFLANDVVLGSIRAFLSFIIKYFDIIGSTAISFTGFENLEKLWDSTGDALINEVSKVDWSQYYDNLTNEKAIEVYTSYGPAFVGAVIVYFFWKILNWGFNNKPKEHIKKLYDNTIVFIQSSASKIKDGFKDLKSSISSTTIGDIGTAITKLPYLSASCISYLINLGLDIIKNIGYSLWGLLTGSSNTLHTQIKELEAKILEFLKEQTDLHANYKKQIEDANKKYEDAKANSEQLQKKLDEFAPFKNFFKNPYLEGAIDTVSNKILSMVDLDEKYGLNMISLQILSAGIITCGAFYMISTDDQDTKQEKMQYIISITIIAFLLSGPGDLLLNKVQQLFSGDESVQTNITSTNQDVVISGGSLQKKMGNIFNSINYSSIIKILAGLGVARYFTMTVDINKSLSENISNLLTFNFLSSKSKGPVSFYFDESRGNIAISGKLYKDVQLNSSSHFGVKGIKMVIKGDSITYKVNDTLLDAYSYIEGRPVHTALVMAYLVKDKHYNRFAPSSSFKSDSGYKYSIEDDGSVKLFDAITGKEIASMTMAIRKQLEGDNAGAEEAKREVCKKLFDVGASNAVCANHFYNILGKSALGMLKNMGNIAFEKDAIAEALISAEPHIKYEILKNLDWKMKISNGKKEMVTTDQWLERLEQDARPGMKALAVEYKNYFALKGKVRNILDKMVMDINNNTRLLDEKYKEAVNQPQVPMRKRKPRLTASQVASLRSQLLTENVALNTPFPMPGVPGAYLYNYTNPHYQIGGTHNNHYSNYFDGLKQSLSGFNQKLSSETERKINSKIFEIKSLNSKLEDISNKINEYTKILRTERYPTGISRTITLSDVENLISQYKSGTQQQTKELVTLSTAFGKIKMLLERQDASTKPAERNFMFDL